MTKRFFPILLLVAAAALAQDRPRIIMLPAKRALTHETLFLMPRVGNPTPSPDGKWVVFSITKPSYDEKESSTDLWLVPAAGGAEPRQLTFSKSAESDVAWSPDSRRIAFSAKREGDEQNQIYILDLGGGEARRVTSLSTGARSPQFRADGTAILFTSVVDPLAKEHKQQKYKVREYTSFPIRNWDRWLDDRQIHLFVQGLAEEATAHDLLAGTKLVQEPGFAGRMVEGSRDEIEAAWAPDGQSIVFAVTTNRNTAAYAEMTYDLYRISTQGGAQPELIARGDGHYARPHFSPDGKTLYAVFTRNDKQVYDLPRLVRFDWPSMQNRIVVTGPPFDRAVGSFAIAPDSQTIWFTAEEAGLEKIYRVSAGGGDAALAIDPGRGVYTHLMIAEKAPVIVAMWGSSVNPAEVVRIDPAKKTHANLTEINVVTANNLDWLAPEYFWFTSKRGKKIHNMLIRPPAFDATKKYPLLVVIHGGPASMSRDDISLRWNYHLLAKPGYVVLTTNYTGSTGFGEKFAQEIMGDPLKGPGDEINEAVDEAIKRYAFIDGTRLAASGASYGGHLANWLEATTTRYKCLISHAGLVNLESQWGTSDFIYHRELMNLGPPWEQGKVWREQNPIRYAAHFKTPMLLSVGERDMRVPLNNTLENWSALQRMRVPSKLLVWPDENHHILNPENSRKWYSEVWEWLAKWL